MMIAIGICEDSPEDLRQLQTALERLVPAIYGEPVRCTAYRCGEALLMDLEDVLRDPRFLRCHQSYLINMDQVARVERDFLLQDGSRVPIRVRSRRQILDAYHRYFLSKF